MKILTGTYILQTTRVAFNQSEIDPTCKVCKEDPETLCHFLLECRSTVKIYRTEQIPNSDPSQGGYSMIAPNQRKREQINQVAQRETQAYHAHKQQNTQTSFNYVGTAGGGQMTQAEARRKQIQESPSKTQKLLKKEENKSYFKQKEEEEIQKMKEEQRKKALLNERRKKEEEAADAHKWDNQRIVANEAFLRRFENKSKRLAGAKPSTSTLPTQNTSSSESSERLQPAGAMGRSAPVAVETHHYSEPEEELSSVETQRVSQLAAIFPQYSETELLQILKQVDFSLDTAVAILED